jgi:hypothetical protein
MDQPTARKALRRVRPGTLRSVQTTPVKGRHVYREYSYYRGYGIDSYLIGFLGARGKPLTLRVARIVTFVPGDRTARGAHVNMSLDALKRLYGGAMHCGTLIEVGRGTGYMPCRVGPVNERHIVLLLSKNDVSGWTVGRIIVQQPGLNIPLVQ